MNRIMTMSRLTMATAALWGTVLATPVLLLTGHPMLGAAAAEGFGIAFVLLSLTGE